jgi:hypothetical protein
MLYIGNYAQPPTPFLKLIAKRAVESHTRGPFSQFIYEKPLPSVCTLRLPPHRGPLELVAWLVGVPILGKGFGRL